MELGNIEAGVCDSNGAAPQSEKLRRPMGNPQTGTPTLHELVENPTRSTALAPKDLAQLAAAVVFGLLAVDRGTEPHPAAVGPDEMLSVEQAAAIIHEEPRWFYRRRLPFIHRISRKKILVSRAGLMRWIATRRSV
jgi:hypothetical protein